MKLILSFVTLLAATVPAHAYKCVGRAADCSYTVYRAKNKISVYANNCRRSDDNGGGPVGVKATISERNGDKTFFLETDEVVTFTGHQTAVFVTTWDERVMMQCQK